MSALILERYNREADDIRDRLCLLAAEVDELGALPVWRATVLDNRNELAAGRRGLSGLYAPHVNRRRVRYPLPRVGGARAADLEELVAHIQALGDYLAAIAVDEPAELGPQKPAKPSKIPTLQTTR